MQLRLGMISQGAHRNLRLRRKRRPEGQRLFSSGVESIRNIGIIAHVDAGKTTTTERMLFYAGKIKRPGEVDSGTTVTDFLEEERNRGITIQSACTTFDWNGTSINIIDTPGHVDFTVEVERSVRVLDGAVAILDAVAGVQAQTETVWMQADQHQVPRIVFVNKMDRDDASVSTCVESIQRRLPGKMTPLILQVPEMDGKTRSHLNRIVDVRNMTLLEYKDEQGVEFTSSEICSAKISDSLMERAVEARNNLLESLAEIDDVFCEEYLASEEPDKLSLELINKAIKRATTGMVGLPVLCGTSLRNRGVQPLLDAICEYLPSPDEKPSKILMEKTALDSPAGPGEMLTNDKKGPFYALAFKVSHDKHRGPLVFVRVYSGSLTPGSTVSYISPTDQQVVGKERVQKILQLHGDEVTEKNVLNAGDIGAVVGLKSVRTGYTLTYEDNKGKSSSSSSSSVSWLPHTDFMPPVFYCSIEADSATEQKALDHALTQLILEDPSLFVEDDRETGQTLLKGMGELHLEVVHNRLQKEYKIGARLGKMRVAYRETLTDETISHESEFSHTIKGGQSQARIGLSIEPKKGQITDPSLKAEISISKRLEADIVRKFGPKKGNVLISEAKEGIYAGLQGGCLLGYPVVGVSVTITSLDASSTTDPITCNAVAGQCVRACLQAAADNAKVLEPLVKVLIRVPNEYMGGVLADITSQRRGQVVQVTQIDQTGAQISNIEAEVPLGEMVGYATGLRASTQGNGSFEMSFAEYRYVGAELQEKLIEDPYSV